MTRKIDITFSKTAKIKGGAAVFPVKKGGNLPAAAGAVDPQGIASRAMSIAKFSGKALASVEAVAPAGSEADRLIVFGLGEDLSAYDWMKSGGAVAGKLKGVKTATVFLDLHGIDPTPAQIADFAMGMVLRSYKFDTYKTKKADDDENGEDRLKVTIVSEKASDAKKAFAGVEGIADGVLLARTLVNEPANILGPVEFAERAAALKDLGVEVEILTEKEMKKRGMGAFLGVSQGATRPPRIAVMSWKGAKAKEKPVAFIGKGVVFDTGGISIKPSSGMEDMKGDMAGAAAVTGLMHALAARKAKANVVGIIGLVENMPDANAQRPGDIVTSMSGQTIEIINTDAEGRLILCDMLTYCQKEHQPQFMVNLATLTGAILVALGHHHAGLFSNNDTLAERLLAAGLATEEKLWRMPLGKEYDKMMDSKFADMKNAGGRFAGSITAAQFLQRFVDDTPWAHLDIAGTGMSSPQTEINQSWASGFGVRLLDELVRAHYES